MYSEEACMAAEAQSISVDKRYILQDRLGQDALGAVYLATNRLTASQVALPIENGMGRGWDKTYYTNPPFRFRTWAIYL